MAQTLSTFLQGLWLHLLFLIPQMLLLILLGCEVVKRRRFEHLWWIGLMLGGQIISSLGTFLSFGAGATAQTVSLRFFLMTSGYLLSSGGFIALLIVVYRSFKIPKLVYWASNNPNDIWPPAPRSN